MRGLWRVVVIGLLWAVPVAAVVVVLPMAAQREQASVAVDLPGVVTVGGRAIDNATSVEVQVHHADPVVAVTPVGGTVTTTREPGPVQVGDELFSIDGVPVLGYSGYPLFRDLRYGDQGADVAALADFLVTLGLLDEQSADDHFGDGVRAAVRALQEDLGVRADGEFRTSYVTRMRPELDPVVTHLAEVGDLVEPGTAVLEGDRPVAEAVIAAQEGAALTRLGEEPLVLRFPSVELELPDLRLTGSQAVDLAEELDALAQEGSVSVSEGQAPASTVPEGTVGYGGGVVALATPVEHGVVPATAVRTDATGTSCLLTAEGAVIRLEQVANGNELGTALVDPSLTGTAVRRDGGSGEC